VKVKNMIENKLRLCMTNSLISIHFGVKAKDGGIPLISKMKKNKTKTPVELLNVDLFMRAFLLKVMFINATAEK